LDENNFKAFSVFKKKQQQQQEKPLPSGGLDSTWKKRGETR